MHIASASHCSDNAFYYAHHKNYMQRPMSNNMHTLNFHATSNIQHTTFHTSTAEQVHMPMSNCQGQTNVVSSANLYDAPYANDYSTIQQGVSYINSSVANSQYLTSSRSMPMNEKFGHADFSYPANYSQTPYDAQHVIRADVASAISAPHTDLNSNDLAPSVIFNASRFNENSATSHAPSSASAANILPPNSVDTRNESEQRFHDLFYSGGNEATLTDLTSIKQGRD